MAGELSSDVCDIQTFFLGFGQACVFSLKKPHGEVNEDSFLVAQVSDQLAVLAVADGLGGHRGGAFASQAAIDVLRKRLTSGDSGHYNEKMIMAFEEAHELVRKKGIGAGTTLNVALVDRKTLRFFNVGDSQAFHLGGLGAIKFKSIEHSPVGYAVESGLMDESEIPRDEVHYVSNVIGMGVIHIDVSQKFKYLKKDKVLIASDGLLEAIELKQVLQLIQRGTLEVAARRLLDECLEAQKRGTGGLDDTTVILYQKS